MIRARRRLRRWRALPLLLRIFDLLLLVTALIATLILIAGITLSLQPGTTR